MTALGKRQLFILTGAALLFLVIWILPRKADKSAVPEEKAEEPAGYSFRQYVELVKKDVPPAELKKIEVLESSLANGAEAVKPGLYDSLAAHYDKLRYPAASAYYFEQKAGRDKGEQSWLNAAYRYFDGFRAEQDSARRKAMIDKAILCYTKVLEINPGNLNAKTDLGVCYTETPQPMKGIMLLREVVSADPKHENAQMNLGILSMKSGQYDKGIDRFNKVIEINPGKSEAYLYLGQCFLKTGNKEKALGYFTKYRKTLSDPEAVKQIDDYIQQIK